MKEGRPQRVAVPFVVEDEVRLAVVEVVGDEFVVEAEPNVGLAEARGDELGQALDGAAQVVAEKADRAAGEGNRVVGSLDPPPCQELVQRVDWVAEPSPCTAPRPQRQVPSLGGEDGGGVAASEGIAPHRADGHGGIEEEGVPAPRERRRRGERRRTIGESFEPG